LGFKHQSSNHSEVSIREVIVQGHDNEGMYKIPSKSIYKSHSSKDIIKLENQSDSMASFREEHNRIINEDNKSKEKKMEKISIEDEKQKLSISMEEEVILDLRNTFNNQNLGQNIDNESDQNWKSNTDNIFEDEKSVKGVFTNSGTIHSDEYLTYSLTNTLKTLSSKAGTK
jgi:hypothetical protein